MDWNDVRIFQAAAQHRTLTAAAHQLRASVPTVARRLDALERRLGFRLFTRSSGGIALTTHGRALLPRATRVAEEMAEAMRLASALQSSGWPDPIRVSATEPVISDILAPALPSLLAAAPQVRIELSSSNDVVSLASRQADIAVRLARPVGDSLVVRRLPAIVLGLFAAKSYLAGRRPSRLDLKRERLLGFDASYGRIAEVVWMEESGLAPAVVVRSSSTRALINAAAAGAGVAIVPRFLARAAVPQLVEIPAPTPIPERTAWLCTHRDLRQVRPLRLVRDWIFEAFQAARRIR